jgi:hypothetical protein
MALPDIKVVFGPSIRRYGHYDCAANARLVLSTLANRIAGGSRRSCTAEIHGAGFCCTGTNAFFFHVHRYSEVRVIIVMDAEYPRGATITSVPTLIIEADMSPAISRIAESMPPRVFTGGQLVDVQVNLAAKKHSR